MRLKVKQADVWAGEIEDRPGALAAKLAVLSTARANLQFVLARRAPETRGQAVVFLTPIRPGKQARAARKAGLVRTKALHSVRVEGPDRPGLGAGLTEALAAAKINLRGLSAAVIGRRFVAYLALDTARDAAQAVKVLRKIK